MSASLKITLSLAALFFMSVTTASPVAAHGERDGDLWHHWAWHDLPLLIVVGGVYALGGWSLWRRAGTGVGISRGGAAAFGVGLLVLFIALVSPLDSLSEELFSAPKVPVYRTVGNIACLIKRYSIITSGYGNMMKIAGFFPQWAKAGVCELVRLDGNPHVVIV